jgi:hypothetical protein
MLSKAKEQAIRMYLTPEIHSQIHSHLVSVSPAIVQVEVTRASVARIDA